MVKKPPTGGGRKPEPMKEAGVIPGTRGPAPTRIRRATGTDNASLQVRLLG